MFKIADLVISKKGRDSERVFMVIEVSDENYVLIADGSLRKLLKPKRKKIKHLEYYGTADTEPAGKITDAALRKMIRNKIAAKEN